METREICMGKARRRTTVGFDL